MLKNFEDALDEEEKHYKKQEKEYEKQYKQQQIPQTNYGGFKTPKIDLPKINVPKM